MKRNLIILVTIFLGVIALMFLSDIISIGDKLGRSTNIYVEYAFYALIVLAFLILVVRPLRKIHTAPDISGFSNEGLSSVKEMKDFGHFLAKNCSYIPDKKVRKEHCRKLTRLVNEWNDKTNLKAVLDDELQLRINGSPEMGVRGLNTIIKQWAQTVFMVTAVSPNSKIDSLSTLVLNHSMIKELVYSTGFRPTTAQMIKLYWYVFTTAILSFCVSDALANVGSVHPFSMFDGMTGHIGGSPDIDIDTDEADFDNMDLDSYYDPDVDLEADNISMENIDPADTKISLSSILKNFKIPGFIVGPLIDGTMNALMTMRIGYVTRGYLLNGAKNFISDRELRKEIKRNAVIDAIKSLPSVILNGSKGVSKGLYKTASLFFKSPEWKRFDKSKTEALKKESHS